MLVLTVGLRFVVVVDGGFTADSMQVYSEITAENLFSDTYPSS